MGVQTRLAWWAQASNEAATYRYSGDVVRDDLKNYQPGRAFLVLQIGGPGWRDFDAGLQNVRVTYRATSS